MANNSTLGTSSDRQILYPTMAIQAIVYIPQDGFDPCRKLWPGLATRRRSSDEASTWPLSKQATKLANITCKGISASRLNCRYFFYSFVHVCEKQSLRARILDHTFNLRSACVAAKSYGSVLDQEHQHHVLVYQQFLFDYLAQKGAAPKKISSGHSFGAGAIYSSIRTSS